MGQILIFDGAMGTMLQQRGLAPGQSPEELNLTMPDVVESVHLDYLRAGADIVITNTFGGSRLKLQEYKLENRVAEINCRAVEIARGACQKAGHGLVAASLGPTGHFVSPVGDTSFDEMYAIYLEQAEAIASARPDYFLLETFSDLGEMRAALLACRDAGNEQIPVICSMTYTNGRTLTGVSPAVAAVTLEAMGASVIGCNCSGGPDELQQVVEELSRYTELPLVAQPNAGLPLMVDGKVQYPLGAEQFADEMKKFLPYQVAFLGGCCGTTPQHIAGLKAAVQDFDVQPRSVEPLGRLSCREHIVEIGGNTLPKMIGERINPTARKKLAQGLRDGDLAMIEKEAELQEEAGAHILDVNVGTHGIDEVQVMADVLTLLQQSISIPLCLDSTKPDVLERALKQYQGKALINSVNGEQASLENILPLAKRYGAAVVGLTLDENGIPAKAEGRLEIAKRIVEACEQYGIRRQDIYIDSLVLTVGTDINGPKETLRTMELIRQELPGVNLLLGVSNVSHGLPNRPKINSAFLAMAIGKGLDLSIINPLDEMMKNAWQSAALLAGRDENAENYLMLNSEQAVSAPVTADETPSLELVTRYVVKGSSGIAKVVQALLDQGIEAMTIINDGLIKGLNEVGEKYEKGVFFLPQLMRSAEVSQQAFDLLEGYLQSGEGFQKGTLVIGTVKGDIHDIGKNMVAVMVKNHGYRVIDLGKNVPAETFVDAVLEYNAEFLGLSALMTTTMQEIPGVIAQIREKSPNTKVIIGGAVITEEFAEEAGADGFGRDAVQTVKLMDDFLKEGDLLC
ncbi:MAG: 5-methyltetrahydrofolate--homocysteine methyltransferase [Peptococcaceae bacterium]|nr:5-methyltetrahydrofolate--homocysteine methyltransferase [Peptococcaceae bacterium]